MKRKYRLIIASVLMIIAGLIKAFDGLALLIKGNQFDPDFAIIASEKQIIIAAFGLLTVSLLLYASAIYLMRTLTKRSYLFSWIVLLLFILDGVTNGYLLFGQLLYSGQLLNIILFLLSGLFLFLGKSTLKD